MPGICHSFFHLKLLTMKHLLVLPLFFFLFIVSSFAAPTSVPTSDEQATVESLKQRVSNALDNLLLMHEVIKGKGHGALLGAIDNLEHSLREWSHRLDRHDAQFYLGQYESHVKRFERRIQEEINIVLMALNNNKRVDTMKTAFTIIGHELIEKANALMKKHHHNNEYGHIFQEMKSEIEQIQNLLIKIGSPHKWNIIEMDYIQLYRHELTMAKLFHELETLTSK